MAGKGRKGRKLGWAVVGTGLAIAAAALSRSGHSPLSEVYQPELIGPATAAPVLRPSAALAAIELQPGFRAELVAREPMIQAPVAAQFDEEGRLWVVEMRTYMPDVDATGELEPGNRIVVLEDVDGDGVMERSSVFLEGLVLPRAVAPCFGGALVIEPPDLYFCKDTNGDGRADVKRKLLSGFGGRENPEHAGNGLLRGLDNWYHISQHNLEFRFDGETIQTRPTPGHGQWGLTMDDLGRLYYTPNSNALLADAYPKHYAVRNPAQGSASGIGELVAPDSTTWPARPTPGVNRGYQPDVLRPDGTLASLTAACGPTIYRAGLLGDGFRGNAFICESAGLLVKRLEVSDKNGVPAAVNAYQGTEFLRSTDERFRPVNSLVGPDGGLYIIDMARGVIQHRTYVTPYLREQIKSRHLEKPLVLGRILRIVPESGTPRARPHLGGASDSRLVELLSDPDGWWRDTAQRLLVERHAVGAEAGLRELSKSGATVPRLHALWTLDGLGLLTEADALAAASDKDATVRAAGARLCETFLKSPAAVQRLLQMADDGDWAVRVQVALTLGELKGKDATAALAGMLRRGEGDARMRGAVVSGIGGRETTVLSDLLATPGWPRTDRGKAVLRELSDAALRGAPGSRREYVELVARAQADPRYELLLGRLRAAQRLDTDQPKVLKLDREPVIEDAKAAPLAAQGMAESLDYLDWPGRPAVKRKSQLRPLTDAETKLFDQGRVLFETCAVCHQMDGGGSPGLAPSLAGSAIAQGPEGRLIRVLLHGLEGKYTMSEMEFDGAMVPAPFEKDEELAAVMTFIRRSWGNAADPVSPQSVARVRAASRERAKAWTRDELKGLPDEEK